jgi:alkanesulfonate monooxygenase SsuD/methylene tetrahydromethanopterin reductase-like flavin-dependent oxidoreductase (luciferase family)
VDLGLQTPQQGWSPAQLSAMWAAADRLGFRAAFTHDHLLPLHPGERPGSVHDGPRAGAQLDGWLLAAVLATGTTRLSVGVLASGVTYRHPAALAKLAVTLDHTTGGRAMLCAGAGWHAEEHRAFGIPFPPMPERAALLDETLAAFQVLCASAGAPVTWAGEHVRLTGAVFAPGPVRPTGIPVLVGGSGPRVLATAGRCADWVNAFAAPDEWPALHERVDAAARAAGRPPSALRRSGFVSADLSGDVALADELVARTAATRGLTAAEARRRVLAGSDGQVADVLGAYRDAGVDMLVVQPQPGAGVEELARLAHVAARL